MSWSKTAAFLREQLSHHRKAIDKGEDLTGLPWFRAMHLREERYRHQIDAICQDFIFSKQWPRMNKIQTHLVSYRLAWAIKFALSLETPFMAAGWATISFPASLDQAQVLHWLLIDTWSVSPQPEMKDSLVDNTIGVLTVSKQISPDKGKTAESDPENAST